MTYSPGVESYIERGKAIEDARHALRTRMRGKKFDTILVHGMYDMQEAMSNHGSIIEPGYFSTSEHFENSDHLEAALAYLTPAWTYARFGNPTVYYLEEMLALLEGYGYDGDVSALTVSSGNTAIFMTAHLLLPQDGKPLNFVATARCYGGTFMIFSKRFAEERGVEVRWVKNPLDVNEWASKIDENTRFLYGEMPSNPSLSVMPVADIAALAHQHDIPFVVDSTVATPALMRPIQHGADIVVQSVTKSMATSGFVIAGAIIARHDMPNKFGTDAMRHDFITYARKPFRDLGPGLSAMSALLALNDLRTLRQRMDYISRNTMQVAKFLYKHRNVEAVYYPGLESDEGHAVAKQYMQLVDSEDDYGETVNRYGHLLSFTVKGGAQVARDVFDRFEMIWRATDLGRIKSVATIPAISTHQQQGEAGRDLASIPANLIRLNVGGEHPSDVIADLEQALEI